MKYKVIFFDLDGTLTDPREGIVNSIQYAADYYGIKTEKQDLLKYIGQPLKDTFKELLGERYTDKLGEEAVSKYRERYANGGIFENKIYPNVKETLALLKEKGFVLCTASSKPQVYVKQILEYFDIDKYFDAIVCGDMVAGSKPEPDIYIEAARRLKLPTNECYALEDSESGLKAALASGCRTIMVPDLWQPDDDMRQKVAAVCKDLEEAAVYIDSDK